MDSLAPALDARKDALIRRYGAQSLPAAGPWNDTIAKMLEHRSVRSYKPDAVPEGTLETMVAAAQSAATSSNMQWTSVVATTDPAKKKVLAQIAGNQKHIEDCPLFLCWIADMNRHASISQAENVEFETMPWLETFMVACIDVALAAQNAVVAAESLGRSPLYIGAMRNDPEGVAKVFNLPKQAFVVFGLCVGYATETGAGEVKPRLPQAAVLQRGELTAVYVAAKDHFVLRAVRLGASVGADAVEVRAGLAAGEAVALDPVRAGLADAVPAQ